MQGNMLPRGQSQNHNRKLVEDKNSQYLNNVLKGKQQTLVRNNFGEEQEIESI